MEIHITKKKKISDDLITCRGTSVQIPFDLIPEILRGLPVKTLARFMCVSKEYASLIRNRDFMKSYLIKSSTRPQSLIFTFEGGNSGNHFFFSLPHLRDQGETETYSSVPTYLMKCRALPYLTIVPSVHGLVCHGPPSGLMVSNPSTRRSITLPKIDTKSISMYHHLGYDTISGDYKVLCMVKGMHVNRGRYLAQELRVLTLGKGNSWRMIEDFPLHCLCTHETSDLCVNGVLYYVALLDTAVSHAVMSFDVRSEKFHLIEGPDPYVRPKLTRYEGKPAVLFSGIADCRINLWVLEDAVKHKWSKKSYVMSTIDLNTYFFHHLFCTNDAGEIVLAPDRVCSKPFYVLFYHPKKDTMRRVYIEGISELKVPLWDKDSCHNIISVFSGQVDNLMFL
ncbi:PREDICTED: F-box protein At2g21930-like [Camelina sativa]|uniref:F-box protein At2g21930-like n=1 Tax=Camelina sativa TaxID=90675 RepID=A0ABM0TNY4_CAMSA|nr:PREDICTED: F-box protein At2g21930-like [Camelina sativa]